MEIEERIKQLTNLERDVKYLLSLHVERLRDIWKYRFDAEDFDEQMILFENEKNICEDLSKIVNGKDIYHFWK